MCIVSFTNGNETTDPGNVLFVHLIHRNKNLTWLHKSGHWDLCGEDHWSGYRPVQTHYWCLRRRNRDKERCMRNVRQTQKDERSQGITLLIVVASTLRQDQRDNISVRQCDTPVCSLSLQYSRCGLTRHIKPCVTQLIAWEHCTVSSAAGEIAQQFHPSPNCTWLDTAGGILPSDHKLWGALTKWHCFHISSYCNRENHTKFYLKVLFDVYQSGKSV